MPGPCRRIPDPHRLPMRLKTKALEIPLHLTAPSSAHFHIGSIVHRFRIDEQAIEIKEKKLVVLNPIHLPLP